MRLERERFTVIERVRRTIERWPMFGRGDLVLVAVSGGGDSLVLLDVLKHLSGEAGIALEVVHVDHGLRPESAGEAAFVGEVADRYGLPFHLRRVRVEEFSNRGERSPEEAARAARYDAFQGFLDETGAARVATGHTADDRVETLLLRLIAGAGPVGLRSIPPLRPPYVRPLIQVWRREVEAYMSALPFTQRRDPSNRDLSIPRNRIRHGLIPLLEEEYNPSVRRVLFRETEILSSLVELLEELAGEAESWLVNYTNRGIEMEVDALRSRPAAVRYELIARALRRLGIDPGFELVEDIILKILEADLNAGLDLGRELVARRVYEKLVLGPRSDAAAGGEVIIPGEGVFELPGWGLELEIGIRRRGDEDPREVARDPRVACMDADRLAFPLRIRGVRPGDRFHPLGAPGRKKIQDFLVDAKLPREQRDSVALLESEGEIAWLLGLRIDERFKVDGDTRNLAILKVRERPGQRGPKA